MIVKKIVAGSMIVAALSVGSFSYAKAFSLSDLLPSKTQVNTVTDVANDVKGEVSDTVDQATNSICDAITPKVDAKISDFQSKFDKQLSYYKNERQDLQLLVENLDEKGINTTKLRSDLVLFDLKQQKFQDDKSSVIDDLDDVKTFKCENQLTKAASSITKAQNDTDTLKSDSEDLLNFLNTTIQDDVEALHS